MTLRYAVSISLFLLITITGFTQPIGERFRKGQRSLPAPLVTTGLRTTATEICDNNIDDDQNGLTDYKDFSCYYSPSNTQHCMISKIAWAGTTSGLLWVDLETGIERFVGNMNGVVMNDITWSTDGRLYGIDLQSQIWQIDPYTSAITRVAELSQYRHANAMTSDDKGNFYFAALSNDSRWFIVKLDPATSQTTVVSDFSNSNYAGLQSGGDLTFLNGSLYLACLDGYLAKINPLTGKVIATRYSGLPPGGAFGMITLGDGLLYLSFQNALYQLDPFTMKGNAVPYYRFKNNPNVYGLANYTEHCNAVPCQASLSISTLSAQPFCANKGVLLRANGTGITGGAYKWSLPDGSTVLNNSLVAITSGRYYVEYYATTDDCLKEDSIDLSILPSPQVNLGGDTQLCEGSQLILSLPLPTHISSYLWQDGSTMPSYTATQPGKYWVKGSNVCGSATDTVIVSRIVIPAIDLGTDTILCPGSSFTIKNNRPRQAGEAYTWSTSANTDTLTVSSAGIYWLQSVNGCGTVRDSILVSGKDSCICLPFYPSVNLGADLAICNYDTVLLENLSHRDGFRYAWQNGSNAPNFNTGAPGVYWVDVSTHCGTVRDSVLVLQKTEGCGRHVFIPNAFTPNRDGKNDIFKATVWGQLKKFELTIYNRWGQILFHTRDFRKGWDGTFNGLQQKTDVFIWSCSYQFEENKNIFQKGTVTLLR